MKTKYRYIKQYLLIMVLGIILVSCGTKADYDALIITGQNNHNWEKSHVQIKTILENSALFHVDVKIIEKGMTDKFVGNFTDCDVVIMDYNGESWSDETRESFEDYMKNGGGMVVYHAANNSFPEWKEYNEMIGLGGWGDRDEKSGPYLYWENGKVVTNNEAGKGGHHPKAIEFNVDIRNAEHPITKGLPSSWLHTKDELYSLLRGPAKNIDLLATSYCDTAWESGTGRHEPVLFTISYGKGRVFHTALGHDDAVECTGFITTLLRGTEWAASGTVTQEIPVDFPNRVSTNTWKQFRPLSIDEIFKFIAKYEIGTSTKYINLLKLKIRKANNKNERLEPYESKMLELLESPDATIDSKVQICRELSFMGSKEKALPVLKRISQQEELKDAANFAIERINNI